MQPFRVGGLFAAPSFHMCLEYATFSIRRFHTVLIEAYAKQTSIKPIFQVTPLFAYLFIEMIYKNRSHYMQPFRLEDSANRSICEKKPPKTHLSSGSTFCVSVYTFSIYFSQKGSAWLMSACLQRQHSFQTSLKEATFILDQHDREGK